MGDDPGGSAATARQGRRLTLVGVGYFVPLGLVALWPTTISEPFARLLSRLEDRYPGSVGGLEFFANIVLFVPAGVLLALLLGPGRRLLAAVAGVSMSVAIELAHSILLPARVASLRDIIANSTGALAGVLIASAARRHTRGPRQRPTG